MSAKPGRRRADYLAVIVSLVALTAALERAPSWGAWWPTLAAGVLTILVVLLVARDRIRPWLRFRPRDVAVGLGVGLLFALLTHALYPLAVSVHPPIAGQVDGLYALLDTPPGRVAALPILGVVVLAEELAFRGLLLDLLQRQGRALAVVLAAALYATPQLATGSWVLVALAFGWGLIWGIERVLTRSLTAPLLTHITWNVVVFLLVPVAGAG